MNTEKNKAHSYALLALSRLFTDAVTKRFGSHLDEPAERYYDLHRARSRVQWITFIVALVATMITLLTYYFGGKELAILVGIFASITIFFAFRHIPEFPGTNVVMIARAWTPNRRTALETGLVQLIAGAIEKDCALSSYIVSGMPASWRQSEVGTPSGDGWKIINSRIVSIATDTAKRHKEAEQKGQPARMRALSVEYGRLSLFTKEIGMEIPDLDTISKRSMI